MLSQESELYSLESSIRYSNAIPGLIVTVILLVSRISRVRERKHVGQGEGTKRGGFKERVGNIQALGWSCVQYDSIVFCRLGVPTSSPLELREANVK